jgi:type 1 fimbria pilin
MRIPLIVAALALASPAVADDTVAGTYDVKVEVTASTCDARPETLTNGKLALTVKQAAVTVKLDKVFPMTGELKDGAITAKTTKLIGTAMAGLSARYAVTGHAAGGTVDLVLTAQYIRQDNNKPHCAQAWKVTGTKTP